MPRRLGGGPWRGLRFGAFRRRRGSDLSRGSPAIRLIRVAAGQQQQRQKQCKGKDPQEKAWCSHLDSLHVFAGSRGGSDAGMARHPVGLTHTTSLLFILVVSPAWGRPMTSPGAPSDRRRPRRGRRLRCRSRGRRECLCGSEDGRGRRLRSRSGSRRLRRCGSVGRSLGLCRLCPSGRQATEPFRFTRRLVWESVQDCPGVGSRRCRRVIA